MKQQTNNKEIRLSDKQKEVIKLMRNNWELGYSTVLDKIIYLQEGMIGYGGISKNIHGQTFNSLLAHKLIYFKDKRFPTSIYHLTDLGKTINID